MEPQRPAVPPEILREIAHGRAVSEEIAEMILNGVYIEGRDEDDHEDDDREAAPEVVDLDELRELVRKVPGLSTIQNLSVGDLAFVLIEFGNMGDIASRWGDPTTEEKRELAREAVDYLL